MTWNWRTPGLAQRLLAALLIVALASAIRITAFGGLGRGTAYLTYYPAVMLAALYGGLWAGFLATALSGLLSFLWIHQGRLSNLEALALGVFLLSCTLIAFICEAMRRAQAAAREAQAKAEAANLAKSVFLASMSHELRTPLNAILGFSSLMRTEAGLTQAQRETLGIINRSGEHLLGLINDVLDMAKIEAGKVALEVAPLDLGRFMLDLTELMRARAEEKNLRLRLDQSSAFPRYVRTDALKLRQVLLNLLGNALKFTEQGGVTLRLGSRTGAAPGEIILVVEVEDTGLGIPPEDQARIFEPFQQAATQGPHKGTGLGLAIVRQYVELLGGRIALASRPGQGSTFRLELPVQPAEASEVAAAPLERREALVLAPGQPECRLLIVEDELANWLLLQRLLEAAGFPVRVAPDGAAGVEAFQAWAPQLIFMDVRMPVLDGLEATRRIRALPGGGAVKIVALTASVFTEERASVLAAGMDDLIRKPYRPAEIFAALEVHLGVAFLRGETADCADSSPLPPLRREDFARLPMARREALAAALVTLDGGRIAQAIAGLSAHDPLLATLLERHAARLEYTAILQTLRAAAGEAAPSDPTGPTRVAS